ASRPPRSCNSCAPTAATRSRDSGCRHRWTRTPAWPSSGAGARPMPARPRPRLDRPPPRAYLADMDSPDVIEQLRALAERFDALAERIRRLAEENRSLRQQHEQLAGERSQLLAKNEQARSRVEAMIARLKSLEQHT